MAAGATAAVLAMLNVAHRQQGGGGSVDDDDAARANKSNNSNATGPHDNSALLVKWSVDSVVSWLKEECEASRDVVQAAREARVDGATLLCMNHDAWAELGVKSRVEQARFMGRTKQLTARGEKARWARQSKQRDNSQTPGGAGDTLEDGETSVSLTDGEILAAKTLKEWMDKFAWWVYIHKNFLGGAEHRLYWHKCIAAALGADGASCKDHYLRFVSMYNVIGVLIFAITSEAMLNSEAPDESIDIVFLLFIGMSTVSSSLGTLLSIVFYNVVSAVHENNFALFAKLSFTQNAMSFVNDSTIQSMQLMMYGAMIKTLKWFLLAYKKDSPLTVWQTVWVLLIPVVWHIGFSRLLRNVILTSNVTLFGGFISRREVEPPGAEDDWHMHATEEEATRLVADNTYRTMNVKDFDVQIVDRYARVAVEEADSAAAVENEDVEQLAGVATSHEDSGSAAILASVALLNHDTKSRRARAKTLRRTKSFQKKHGGMTPYSTTPSGAYHKVHPEPEIALNLRASEHTPRTSNHKAGTPHLAPISAFEEETV